MGKYKQGSRFRFRALNTGWRAEAVQFTGHLGVQSRPYWAKMSPELAASVRENVKGVQQSSYFYLSFVERFIFIQNTMESFCDLKKKSCD